MDTLRWSAITFLAFLMSVAGCVGTIAGTTDDGAEAPPGGAGGSAAAGLPGRNLAATIGVRRLSVREYNNTIRDLLGDNTGPATGRLPPGALERHDPRNPFDSYIAQENQIAGPLIDAVAGLAGDVAAAFVKDVARRDKVVGCTPTSRPDCLQDFVNRFGRRALRRPLTDEDVQLYLQMASQPAVAGDFYAAVEDIVRAFLQDIEFLHRIEVGAPVTGVPGLFRLSGWEVASRLSYFLWGSMPPDWLLDRVEKENGLSTPTDVRTVAGMLLADARARDQVASFHALWLGYADLARSGYKLAPDMLNESNALVGKVIFDDQRPWQDLFRSNGTIVSFELADHYKLRIPAGFTTGSKPMWVPYDGTTRRGLVSQTSILRFGSKFGDTSPTVRGKEIRERFFCDHVPEPDPALLAKFKADTSAAPVVKDSPCKWERYENLRNTSTACDGCHAQLDPIGFGLENFDAVGRYRGYDTDPGNPGKVLTQCRIDHQGTLYGDHYRGPGELQDLMLSPASATRVTSCVLGKVYQFSTGRTELDAATDRKVVEVLENRTGGGDLDFRERLLDIVVSDAFAHRRMEN